MKHFITMNHNSALIFFNGATKSVLNCTLTPTQGKYTFDPVSKLLAWDVGKVDPQKPPNIHGTINLQSGAPVPDSNPSMNVSFLINQMAVSGLKV